MKLRNYFFILLAFIFSLPVYAVTDKEMEEAKVIAAKLYLRWANNGSGYLDEVSATSMSDLESKLKNQEKENIKAFKSVNIPSDYASWDKERFVQFWGTTFFTSPSLSADGKRAKDRVKAKVKEMNVTAPTTATVSENPAQEKEETLNNEPVASTNETAENGVTIPEPMEVLHNEEAIADSMEMIQAEEQSMAITDRQQKGKSNTWIYIVILVVLVILVVWLMVYAANMMKKQGKDDKTSSKESGEQTAGLKKEIKALEEARGALLTENKRLKEELEAAKSEIAGLRKKMSEQRPAQVAVAKGSIVETLKANVPPAEEPKPQSKILNEIYLGRANAKGLFVRGDRKPNPDHSVFRLETQDGLVGTFRILETPEAIALVTSNPLQYLAGGCISDNFEDAENATTILTEKTGTAILENGCWKVLRKCKIKFE